MDKKIYNTYLSILKSELIVALGCTEPIAIAFASAKAKEVLGKLPEKFVTSCSGNMIKNVKSVTVPNSGNLHGIEAATILGAVGGDAKADLAVLEAVKKEDIELTKELLEKKICEVKLVEGVANLYIVVRAEAGNDWVEVEISDTHLNITRIEKNGEMIFSKDGKAKSEETVSEKPDKSLLNVKDIIEFANTVDIEDIREVLERQIAFNKAIALEGLNNEWGAGVGKTLLEFEDKNKPMTKAKAMAAAGSDARMNGCPLPVVINSGSGNQGITCSMPVVEYASYFKASHEMILRALALSNLIAVHQKKYIGSLSAYCGAVSAACGAGTAICYLAGGGYKEISDTITNTIDTIGGMVCDGAKSSCAAKIAVAVGAAIQGYEMAMKHRVFQPGEGMVKDDIEGTIESIGRMGRVGMKSTDIEILNIMIED